MRNNAQSSLFDRPVPFARGSDTSRAAARAVQQNAPRLRRLVLDAYQAAGPAGLTADEAARMIGESVLATRPRVTELYQAGRLEKTVERRQNASGLSATVLRIAP